VLGEVARFSLPLLSLAATVVIASGLLHGGSLARSWVLLGILFALALVAAPPPAVALVGMAATLLLAARGRKLALRQFGAVLGCSLTMLVCASGLYGTVAAAEIVSWLDRGGGEGGSGAGEGGSAETGGGEQSGSPEYAELCSSLPNPLDIGHGLGQLFRRDGAVEAGCGGPAESVANNPAVWFSLGMCKGSLRSLAVSAAGHDSVLLYGDPAQFAWEAARSGELLYAESGQPGSGDLDIITTIGGSQVFIRSSPSARPRSKEAKECGDIDEVAHPFVSLAPPLAGLWLQYVLESGWTWPENDEGGRYAFRDGDLEELEASGGCGAGGSCYLDPEEGLARRSAVPAVVSLAALAAHMPAPIE
jgi:xanthosine utilization system XapX-like protein